MAIIIEPHPAFQADFSLLMEQLISTLCKQNIGELHDCNKGISVDLDLDSFTSRYISPLVTYGA